MNEQFQSIQALTFDCYGTLIDWESGLLGALRPILASHRVECGDATILKNYSELEAALEAGDFKPYREILRMVVRGFGERFGFTASPAEVESLPASLPGWKPFPDTVAGLKALGREFRLSIISNVDDDLFSGTAKHFPVRFAEVITALECRSYKPAHNNFQTAMKRLAVNNGQLLHCAESLYHDVAPCRQLGIRSVWVNRRKAKTGPGATLSVDVRPDYEVGSIAELAALLGV
jgi:2-haloacid dehalogenase